MCLQGLMNSINDSLRYTGNCLYKSHSELQREITTIVLAPSPYFFISSICHVHINVFARFDEIPSMTLLGIQETVYTKAIKNYKGK